MQKLIWNFLKLSCIRWYSQSGEIFICDLPVFGNVLLNLVTQVVDLPKKLLDKQIDIFDKKYVTGDRLKNNSTK